ncbi:hypothetical protein IQ241_16060 [Romeria aff. gracilis LEGE 07310]|uniref:Uncharacterized protein n=1 Tax=Vasconcelosia minhoensis LEGE 07310 TaxID=915328 RepID=A0A8J7AYS1_9CYAN|nr:hypothetical protein [Romeria gracilis]MBE9078792.1 hypothetical protein [Romeria aff. gracilis LEGE 07310]
MSEPKTQTCPICQVKIMVGTAGGDRVLFSAGPPGTRAKLWARVCQFNKKSGCINEQAKAENISADDYYKEAPNLNL